MMDSIIERVGYLPVTELSAQLDELGREVDQRWKELEQECRMPTDVTNRMAAIGLFDQLAPVSSGLGGRPVDWFHNSVRAAWWNGSFGWLAAQGAAVVAGISAQGPHVMSWMRSQWEHPIAVATNAGSIEYEIDGDQVVATGRIPFASGCDGADMIFGMAKEAGVQPSPEAFVWVGAPAEDWTIVRDWDVIGLRGTGSHSIEANGLRTERAWLAPAFLSVPSEDPIRVVSLANGGSWVIAMSVAATQLGIARRALDEAYAVTVGKRPAPTFELLDSQATVRAELMELEGRWHQVVSGVTSTLNRLWETALAGQLPDDRQRALQATMAHLANVDASDIVARIWLLVGTSALRPGHPIARCHRDIQPMTGHISCNRAVLGFAAARWRGEDPGNIVV